jgi:hypothetical protein
MKISSCYPTVRKKNNTHDIKKLHTYISLLSNVSKVMEKAIYNGIYMYLIT